MAKIFEMESKKAAQAAMHETIHVWGQTPMDLHDAYWRSQGVQCVRRGDPLELQTGSDLYMLLEPEQCAIFNLAALSNAMVWNRAPLSRIRVLSTERRYVEKVIVNSNDELVRITREYGDLNNGSCRVLITRRSSLAQTASSVQFGPWSHGMAANATTSVRMRETSSTKEES